MTSLTGVLENLQNTEVHTSLCVGFLHYHHWDQLLSHHHTRLASLVPVAGDWIGRSQPQSGWASRVSLHDDNFQQFFNSIDWTFSVDRYVWRALIWPGLPSLEWINGFTLACRLQWPSRRSSWKFPWWHTLIHSDIALQSVYLCCNTNKNFYSFQVADNEVPPVAFVSDICTSRARFLGICGILKQRIDRPMSGTTVEGKLYLQKHTAIYKSKHKPRKGAVML